LLRGLEKSGLALGEDYVRMGEAYLAARDRGKAKRAFQKAIKKGAPAQGYHGIGMVYLDMGAHGHMALVNFRKALGADSTFTEAQYQIAQIYRSLRPLDAEVAYLTTISMDASHPDAHYQLGRLLEDEGRQVEAKVSYQNQIDSNPAHGFASLNLGRQMYVEGEKKTAARIFSALIEAGGEVETESYLEMALMSQDARDFESADRLFEAHITRLPQTDRVPFTDIEHVASKADLAVLASVPEGERDEMRRRYWARQDPAPLSSANERLLEHYRRVAYSRAEFSEGEDPFDERGRAYVRMGRPDHVSRSGDIKAEDRGSVINARLNFVSRMRLGVEVVPGLPTYPVGGGVRWEYWVYADLSGGVELTFTSQFSDGKYRYADIPSIGSLASINELLSMHGDNVVAEAAVDASSIYRPDFADLPVDFYYYPASFRGEAGNTRLEVYYGLPADDIARTGSEDGELIVFDRAVALHDSVWNEVHRVTDKMVFRYPTEKQVADGAFIPGVMPVDLAPGDYWMSLQIRDRLSGKSQVYKQPITLGNYASRDTLQVSDVELAFHVSESDDAEGEFVKRGLKVIPMSSKSFQRDQNAFVYFEIYNLQRDEFGQTHYKVEYTVRSFTERSMPARILRGLGRVLRMVEGEQEVRVSFEQTGSEDEDIAYVELNIRESRPGGQMVSVKVTDLLSEMVAEKSIQFSVDGY
jgi:GWxTD domain-containing protein